MEGYPADCCWTLSTRLRLSISYYHRILTALRLSSAKHAAVRCDTISPRVQALRHTTLDSITALEAHVERFLTPCMYIRRIRPEARPTRGPPIHARTLKEQVKYSRCEESTHRGTFKLHLWTQTLRRRPEVKRAAPHRRARRLYR